MKFAHLHTHTIFSIKDATAKSKDYVRLIHEYNSKSEHEIIALAASEHGNLFSMCKHYEACVTPLPNDPDKKTIKPLIANEIYHVDDLSKVSEYSYKERYHMPLIAKDDVGLKNLVKITTHSGINK